MGFKTSDITVSSIFALFSAIFASIVYRLDWPWILLLTVVFDLLFLYILQNQAKNERKLHDHRTVFPNPMGGGILGQYMLRPWQNELDLMGQPKLERWNRELKKLDRVSKKRTRRMRRLQKVRS